MHSHDVRTTPQTFIESDRIGGYGDLKRHFGYRILGMGDTTYRPVIAIFASTALMELTILLSLCEGYRDFRHDQRFTGSL
jgi:hypothetical protein